MPDPAEQAVTLPAVRRSRKLARAGMLLGVLPVLLPFPFWGLEILWIAPIARAQWAQCRLFTCPPAAGWERLGALLVLGPSILVAVAALVCGYIGIIHWPRYPTEKKRLFYVGFALGMLWAVIFGMFLLIELSIAGETL